MPEKKTISDIPEGIVLIRPIFSETGELLLGNDIEFTNLHAQAFKECGISDIYLPTFDETVEECGYALRFAQRDVKDMRDNEVVSVPVKDENGRVLVPAGQRIEDKQKQTLARFGISFVYVRKMLDPALVSRVSNLKARLSQLLISHDTDKLKDLVSETQISPRRMLKNKDLTVTALVRIADDDASRTIKIDPAIRGLIEPKLRLSEPESEEDAKRVGSIRAKLLAELNEVYDALGKQQAVDGKKLEKIAREITTALVGDRHHRLHITEEGEGADYIVSHALNVAALTVNIAGRLGYALDELLELACGALVHDIGMLSVPSEIREQSDPLNGGQRRLIRDHPNRAIDYCKLISEMPMAAALIAYQVNERLDGSGYPNRLRNEMIHPYSRIVSAASSYDAMVRERPLRPAVKPYQAMNVLLGEVHLGKLDSEVVRALLETLGLFPIGSGVKLSNGQAGIVLDTNGTIITRPVVLVESTADGSVLDAPLVIDLEKAEHSASKIVEALLDDDE